MVRRSLCSLAFAGPEKVPQREEVGVESGHEGPRGHSDVRRIQGAIELHLAGLRADGLPVPKPRQRAVIPRRTKHEINFYATVEVAA
jgi:hypothetical protein